MTRLPLALLFWGLFGAGCTASKTAVVEPRILAGDYYPLSIGITWTYEAKLLGEARRLEVTTLRKNDDGFVEDSTGAQMLVDAFGIRDQKRYLLRNPVKAGTKWTNVVSVSSVETYEIVAADQTCEAPAGRWVGCVVVESRNRVEEGVTLINEMTFAPGVGIVRLATVLESNGKQIPQSTLTLVEFRPRPG